MSYASEAILLAAVLWIFAGLYLTFHRDRFPDSFAFIAFYLSLIATLVSINVAAGRESLGPMPFTARNIGIVLFVIGPFVFVFVARASYPAARPDRGNLP